MFCDSVTVKAEFCLNCSLQKTQPNVVLVVGVKHIQLHLNVFCHGAACRNHIVSNSTDVGVFIIGLVELWLEYIWIQP